MTLHSGQQYLTLAQRINAAALDPGKWLTVVEHLSVMAGDIRTHMFGYDLLLGHSDPSTVTHGYDPDFQTLYNTHYHKMNVWAPTFAMAPPGQILSAEEMFDAGALRRTEFYADWVLPQEDIAAGAGSVLLRDDTRAYLIGGNIRARDAERLERPWRQLLGEVVPLIRQALEINRALAGAQLESHLLRIDVETGAAGVLILNARGRVVSLNPRAGALLEAGVLARLTPGGGLAFHDPVAADRLAAIEARASRLVPQIFGLRDAQGNAWQCHVAALSTEEDLAANLGNSFFTAPPLIALALTRSLHLPSPEDRVASQLSLTPAEAAVALMLADGADPRRIAEDRGTQLVTVRNQIKSAMQKAGYQRQIDLVRRVIEVARPTSGES